MLKPLNHIMILANVTIRLNTVTRPDDWLAPNRSLNLQRGFFFIPEILLNLHSTAV